MTAQEHGTQDTTSVPAVHPAGLEGLQAAVVIASAPYPRQACLLASGGKLPIEPAGLPTGLVAWPQTAPVLPGCCGGAAMSG